MFRRHNSNSLRIDFYKNKTLERYSIKDQKPVTLNQLITFGRTAQLSSEKILRSGSFVLIPANYVREELPVRIAHRIRELQNLPFIVGSNPNMEQVYNLYWEAFENFRQVPEVKTLEENQAFCLLVDAMLLSHRSVIPSLVQGMYESKEYMSSSSLNKFVNETLQSRVSRRVLAEQHISLTSTFSGKQSRSNTQIGIVNTACQAYGVVTKCSFVAGELFKKAYDIDPPKVLINGYLEATFGYITDHIEYILCELLKNSMKYTYQTHSGKKVLPPIRVTIGVGEKQLMFRVSDEGGGISKEIMNTVWNFVKLEKSGDVLKHPEMMAKVEENIPITDRLGLGLPMSKVYADYWGGNVSLYTMQGSGTDAYLTLSTGNPVENMVYKE